jgi:hypothetical protein
VFVCLFGGEGGVHKHEDFSTAIYKSSFQPVCLARLQNVPQQLEWKKD